MGLDIYFNKLKPELKNKPEDAIESEDLEDMEVGYFRKVNFLLPFFDYGENLSYKKFGLDEIRDLKKRCDDVLADNSLADELLPTEGGFFFGSTSYDEWYFGGVESVSKWCGTILNEYDDDDVLTMQCWW